MTIFVSNDAPMPTLSGNKLTSLDDIEVAGVYRFTPPRPYFGVMTLSEWHTSFARRLEDAQKRFAERVR